MFKLLIIFILLISSSFSYMPLKIKSKWYNLDNFKPKLSKFTASGYKPSNNTYLTLRDTMCVLCHDDIIFGCYISIDQKLLIY